MSYKYDNYYVDKTFCKENKKLKRKNDDTFHILTLNIMKNESVNQCMNELEIQSLIPA